MENFHTHLAVVYYVAGLLYYAAHLVVLWSR